MRVLLSIFIIVSLVFPRAFNFIVYVNYEINLEQYMEACENKEEPEMECNGKCHLMAEFVQPQEQQAPTEEAPTLNQIQDVLLFFQPSANLFTNALISSRACLILKENLPESPIKEFFIPPRI